MSSIKKYLRVSFAAIWALIGLIAHSIDSQAAGGGGVGGPGGGNFSIPVFWYQVQNEIIPDLKELRGDSKILTPEQVDLLIKFMDPKVTKVSLIPDQPFAIVEGQSRPVDALNYPDQIAIELYKPTWQERLKEGFDINYLILHEFMGLAKIDDTNGLLSSKIIPPTRAPINFESTKLTCKTAPIYIHIAKASWFIRDMPMTSQTAKLSEAKHLNQNPKCAKVDNAGSCLQYIDDYKLKTVHMRLPIVFDTGDSPGGNYFIDASVRLVSSYYAYGWGGAANNLFLRNPQFEITWSLTHVNSQHQTRTIALLNSSARQTDEFSDHTTLYQSVPVPEFTELLERNGFELSLTPYNNEVTDLFNTYNIAGYLEQTATANGMKDRAQIDSYVIHRMFKGAPANILPFRIDVNCRLENE